MKSLLLSLIFLVGCASKAPSGPSLSDLMSTKASQWPLVGWVPEYDIAVKQAAKGLPFPAFPCGKDVVSVVKAMASAESSFKRTTVYQEPPPPKGPGTKSIGLLQLSLGDQKNYKLDCGWKSDEDIKHPIKNLYCGVNMLSKLHQKYPKESFYRSGGRYWSVLRSKTEPAWAEKNQSGHQRFLKALGCAK